jgi:hypothetical protein
MHASTLSSIATIISVVSPAVAQNVVGTFIFGRHGDRLQKPTVILTPVGSQEVYEQGSFMHNRYFNSSSEYAISGLNYTYVPTQLNAFAPNSDVLQKSAMGFLQGLYPPLDGDVTYEDEVQGSEMANGTVEITPLDGFQYVIHDGIDTNSPNNIWIQGDTSCPAYTNASNAYFDTEEFLSLNSSTFDFYQSLYPLVEGAFTKEELNYGNAYEIFDHFVVNSVHNQTFADLLSNQTETDNFNQVRYLQDVYSKATNYNASNSNTTIGGATMLAFIQSQLNLTQTTGAPYISYAAGSYDTFYQLFGRLGLYNVNATVDNTFTGILNYAAAAVFDLIEMNNDYYIQFSFRNGTDDSAEALIYPIFGSTSNMIPYSEFVSQAANSSIANLQSWCKACDSWSQAMCAVYSPEYLAAIDGTSSNNELPKQSKLSLADAGGIGAGVTIGVFLIAGLAIWGLMSLRNKKAPSIHSVSSTAEKSV